MPRTSIGELILMSTYGQRRDLLCVAICSPPLFFPFCVRFARHHNKDNLKTLCIRLYTIRYSIIIYPYGSKPCLGRYLTLQIIPQTLPKKVLGSIGEEIGRAMVLKSGQAIEQMQYLELLTC